MTVTNWHIYLLMHCISACVTTVLLLGHSMSSDPAELDISSDPHQNSWNFIRGKISAFWAQERWNFFNWTCFSKIMRSQILMFFKKIAPKKFWKFAVGTSTDCHSYTLNIFIQYFTVKCKVPCRTKQDRKFFTGDLWTLVNSCYKATCFSCAFTHDDIFNTYNSNSATSIDFIFFNNLRASVMEILYLVDPCLFFNFRQKVLDILVSGSFLRKMLGTQYKPVGTQIRSLQPLNTLASGRNQGFSQKKTPKCMWLCAGNSLVL